MKKEQIKYLILVRGIPGSGKSTVANLLSENGKYPVCTADDYHMINGKYEFKYENLGYAHRKCQEKAADSMKNGYEKIFVANTNVKITELNEYYNLAEKYNYVVVSLIVENRHDGKSIHGVPDEKIEQMKENFNIKL